MNRNLMALLLIAWSAACGSGVAGTPSFEGPGPGPDESEVGNDPLPSGQFFGFEDGEGGQGSASSSTAASTAASTGSGMTNACSVSTACLGCAESTCPSETAACLQDDNCCCWASCLDDGQSTSDCDNDCGGISTATQGLLQCATAACSDCVAN